MSDQLRFIATRLSGQHNFVFFSINVQIYIWECRVGRELNLTRFKVFVQGNMKMKERGKSWGCIQGIESWTLNLVKGDVKASRLRRRYQGCGIGGL